MYLFNNIYVWNVRVTYIKRSQLILEAHALAPDFNENNVFKISFLHVFCVLLNY